MLFCELRKTNSIMNKNGQSAAETLNNNQIQVILTGKFGDGCLVHNGREKLQPNSKYNVSYTTNSTHLDYIAWKKALLGNLCSNDIRLSINCGYKQNIIYSLSTSVHPEITKISKESIEDSLNRMDELGFALWCYDDSSLHKRKDFYNLCTHSFTEDVQRNVIVPFLKNRFDIIAKPTIERKQDGREFCYLRICKFDGAFIISQILSRFPVSSFSYKRISSETIQKWSKLQEQLKSAGIDYNNLNKKHLSSLLNKVDIRYSPNLYENIRSISESDIL